MSGFLHRARAAAFPAALGFFAASAALAQAWGWAVYRDGNGQIFVAEMARVPEAWGWTPVAPFTHRSRTQAQAAACDLTIRGDLRNRKYRSPQIERGEWHC